MALFRKPRSPFWWYDIRFQGKRYRATTNERTKTAAGTVEAAIITKLSQGVEAPAKSSKLPTLREFSERFLRWSENCHTLTPATKKYYEYGHRLLMFTRLADMPLNRITNEIVECTPFTRPVMDRRTNVPTRTIVMCSATYTNQALRTLKAMFGKAVDWEVLRTRPTFATLPAPGRDRVLDHDTEIRLQQQFEADTDQGRHNYFRLQAWLVMVVLQDTGMRPDEVFPMRIENLDFENERIWVPRGKTAKARRFVGMSERMKISLMSWCKDRAGWVFPSKRSKSGHLETIAKGFQAARARAGLDRTVVPYLARHTYGTFQMQATGNIFAVSKHMGHASVKSMEPYQHPETSELNSAINERNRAREIRRFEMLTESGHTFGHTTNVVQ